MSTGEHTHEWKYNDVTEIMWTSGVKNYKVIRFCTQCFKVEEISLVDKD